MFFFKPLKVLIIYSIVARYWIVEQCLGLFLKKLYRISDYLQHKKCKEFHVEKLFMTLNSDTLGQHPVHWPLELRPARSLVKARSRPKPTVKRHK